MAENKDTKVLEKIEESAIPKLGKEKKQSFLPISVGVSLV